MVGELLHTLQTYSHYQSEVDLVKENKHLKVVLGCRAGALNLYTA